MTSSHETPVSHPSEYDASRCSPPRSAPSSFTPSPSLCSPSRAGLPLLLRSPVSRIFQRDRPAATSRVDDDAALVLPVGPHLTSLLDAALYTALAPLLSSTVAAGAALLGALFDARDQAVRLVDAAWHALLMCPPHRETRELHRATIRRGTDAAGALETMVRR
eukprot:CAMPEP_0194332826 /NCGR_PEP_ID=MMETSP0171-20130528/60502_1 /TAXON_ID=218684 /ORGANISM="Corethron pennatum, Strain L29A3" /LENGTH=162 /DNA_ID=CAMNT_0039094831 /DNA_START=20 /DNA_END=504 /DNA_ORIENTATION=-